MEDQGKRDAYRKKMEAQLAEWEAKIEELKARARKTQASAEIEVRERMERLRAKQAEYQRSLAELRTEGKEAWDTLKEGMEKAASDLKDALDQARSKFG